MTTNPANEPAWTAARAAEELAVLLAKARTRGNVYMGGEHNPTPSEVRTAREFVDGVLAHQAAELDAALGGEARGRQECNELYEEIALLKRELANAQQAYNRAFGRLADIENEEQGR